MSSMDEDEIVLRDPDDKSGNTEARMSSSMGKKRKCKRSNSSEELDESMQKECDILWELINKIEHTITGMSKEHRNKLVKDVKALKECGKNLERCFKSTRRDEDLKGQIFKQNIVLNEHTRLLKEIKDYGKSSATSSAAAAASVSTYAATAAQRRPETIKVPGLKKPIPAFKTFKFMLENKDKNRPVKGEDLLKKVKQNINPSALGFKPNMIYANKDNRVVVESKDNCYDRIKNSVEFRKLNVEVIRVGKINPRITIFNVPSDVGREELPSEIVGQNSIEMDEDSTMKPLYKFGPRDRHYVHWVLEVDPKMRKRLHEKKTLYVGWHSCNVEDKIYITKCYNCQGYGHIASKCNQKKACGHCAAEHDTRHCTIKDKPEEQKCALCVRAKIEDVRHRPRDSKCQAYKRRMELYVANIDFGEDVNNLGPDNGD